MNQNAFDKAIVEVIEALRNAGYDPIAQLTGYIQNNDDTYITRYGNARNIARTLDKIEIATYIESIKSSQS